MAFHSVEFRSVIKFFVLRKRSNQEIIFELQEVYGDNCPCKATIYNWIREFRNGRESVFDSEREGRPKEISVEKNDLLENIVKNERRITTRELAERLKVSKGTLSSMLLELGIRKLCSRFVPKLLTAEMRQARLDCVEQNLDLYSEHGDDFLSNIVTEDETPLSLYIPETKRQSSEWVFPNEKPRLKLRSGTSHKKCLMLTIFWDKKGPIKVDFADSKTRINSDYYCQLIKEVRSLRRKPRNQNLWLLHDNAPIHTSQRSMAQISSSGFHLVAHPPYSPDIAPSDFHLFKQLKNDLRGEKFDNSRHLRERVTALLSSYPPNFYEEGFQQLITRWQKCKDALGSYIEK